MELGAAGQPHAPGPSPKTRAALRLTGVGTFESILRQGRRRDGRYMQLISVPAARGETAGRAGFIVGRKAMRRAVDRNRLKRKLRELLRGDAAWRRYDVVFRVRQALPRQAIDDAVLEARSLLAALAAAKAKP